MTEREKLLAAMEAILDAATTEERELTAEETAQYEELDAKLTALDANAQRRAQVQARRAAAPSVARVDAPAVTPNEPSRIVPIRGPEAPREFENLGEFIYCTRFRPTDQRLQYVEGANLREDQRMDTGASGGFLVPQQFASAIFSVPPQSAVVRPRATVIAAGDPPDAKITFPALDQRSTSNVFGGVTFGKVAEGGAKPETGVAFRQFELEPQEWAAFVDVTDKLLRNWGAASSYLTTLLRSAAAAYEDTQFLTGNGIGGPLGVLNLPSIHQVTRTTNSQFVFADYKEMVSRLKPGGSPVWVLTLALRPFIISLRNLEGSPAVGDGSLLWAPSVVPGQPETLGGIPIIWNERSPALGAKGDAMLLDLSFYYIKDGSGPFVAASEHVQFTANMTRIKIFGNVDGRSPLSEAYTTEGGYVVSPFVVLSANA
jgi:HK97 family phage major capsid protein